VRISRWPQNPLSHGGERKSPLGGKNSSSWKERLKRGVQDLFLTAFTIISCQKKEGKSVLRERGKTPSSSPLGNSFVKKPFHGTLSPGKKNKREEESPYKE